MALEPTPMVAAHCGWDTDKKSREEIRMGYTLTLDMPEDVYQSLIRQAKQTGQLPEAVAVQLLATATQHRVDDSLEQFIGAFRSHGADWTDEHDVYLEKAVAGSMNPATFQGNQNHARPTTS
jgi:hypothetical protein